MTASPSRLRNGGEFILAELQKKVARIWTTPDFGNALILYVWKTDEKRHDCNISALFASGFGDSIRKKKQPFCNETVISLSSIFHKRRIQ
jgi:hypothetical protein